MSTDGTDEAGRPSGGAVYCFTVGKSSMQSEWPDRLTIGWPELTHLLSTHGVGGKDGTCIVPAIFLGTRRHKADADRIDVAFLDSDTGATLDEIRAAIAARGWSAIISSTHSHLCSATTVKRGNWDKFRSGHDDADTAAEDYLISDKGYLPAVAAGATVVIETADQVTFQHQPCPKFRVVIPLLRPWRADSFGTQAAANAAWKDRVEALAHALNLRHDQSCTDTSRLFYLPRRPSDGPPPETAIVEGSPCDIFDLPAAAKPERNKQRRKAEAHPFDRLEVSDPTTGETLDLRRWERRNAGRFQIVTALKARRPGAFVDKVIERKHHLRCVNASAHTSADEDYATFAMNASEAEAGRFVVHCLHAHCAGYDHLAFLKQMIDERWLSIADLTDPAFQIDGKPPPPTIRYVGGKLHEVVNQAEQALIQADLGLYQRGTFVVRAGTVRATASEEDVGERRRIIKQGNRAVAEAMTEAAQWEKFDRRSRDWINIDAPLPVADTYLQRIGRWELPVLAGLLDAPTLRADGSILSAIGYDCATGLLLEPNRVCFPRIAMHPTKEQARAALDLLCGLIAEFCFVGAVDRAVALSAILTAVIRRSLPTAPLHAFDAPVAGSGKSKLVDITNLIASGRLAAVIAQGKSEEEMEKRLGAMLLAGEQVVAIDNCEWPLGGDFLCQMLTQQMLRMRVLGHSEVPELPTSALVTATGNNLTLVGDMTRRAVLCRLDPKCERPELLRFESDPIAVLHSERAKYLVAALTILRAFHVAGRPRQTDPLGSFEDWSNWVRGALIWLGEADPVESMEAIRSDDPRLESITAVLTQWSGAFADRTITIRQIIETASEQRTALGSGKPEFVRPDFREVLLTVAGAAGAINSRSLGRWIAGLNGRIVGGWRVERGADCGGVATWRLRVLGREDRRGA